MVVLGDNRYGKAEVRIVSVSRGAGPGGSDVVRDRNLSSSLSGDLAGSHLTGDNSHVLPTDTQKNTMYAFTKQFGNVEPEALGIALGEHFVASQPAITRARLSLDEYPWVQLPGGPHSFARSGQYVRKCVVVHDATEGTSVVAGVDELVVLNTTNSEFWGFPRDEYTTLPETNDRMLATRVSAMWRYRGTDVDWAGDFGAALLALLDAFATTYSYSLQQTLYAMGTRVIEAVPSICEVRLALPNKHHYLADLRPFGLTNDNEVYNAGDRPYGLIEGTVSADDAPDPGLAWI